MKGRHTALIILAITTLLTILLLASCGKPKPQTGYNLTIKYVNHTGSASCVKDCVDDAAMQGCKVYRVDPFVCVCDLEQCKVAKPYTKRGVCSNATGDCT